MNAIPEEPSERPRHRGEETNKTDIKEIIYEDIQRIYLAQTRVQWRDHVNSIINF
jgi:hypothetical protein